MKTKRLIIQIIALLLVQSCTMPQQMNVGNTMRKLFCGDLKAIESKLYGSYQAEAPMTNGNPMSVVLAENNSYVEKNAFGTFYGTWSVSCEGFCYYKTRYEIVIMIDSVDSPFSLHYNGDQTYQSMRSSMYYYYPHSGKDSAMVTMKDRTGSPINLFHVVAYDSANNTIDVLNAGYDTANSIEQYKIPANTAKIGVVSMNAEIDCDCRYNPDSGNVVIVATPHCQDSRMRVKGRNLYFYQYDKYGIDSRKTRIKLLRQNKAYNKNRKH